MVFTATVAGRSFRVEVHARDGRYRISVDDRTLDADACFLGERVLSLLVDGESHEIGFEDGAEGQRVHLDGEAFMVGIAERRRAAAAARDAAGPQPVRSPMPGRVVAVLVRKGERVEGGQSLVVIEAMKMENELRAPRAGEVREIAVREGEAVDAGAVVAVVA
jgi:acetyl/propionyl-CoA carboxylase alpha subunit